MVNIKDVAKAAGVSITTVSNVLNGRTNVGQGTRERVLSICKELDYHPNFMARNLKSGKKNTVLFSFSDFDRYFYLKIIEGIHDCLTENEIGLIICTKMTIDSFLRNGSSNGAIILDKSISNEQILSAAGDDMKIVMLDRIIESPYIYNVITENYTSMREMISVLIKKGNKSFDYVSGLETMDNSERLKAFRDALTAHDIPVSGVRYFSGDYTLQSGIRVANEILKTGILPEVVVCANDDMAVGIIDTFQTKGYKVPEQIMVTGFDGDMLIDQQAPRLTTVTIPRYESGYKAAQTLIDVLDGKKLPYVQRINTTVTWGDTTK